MRPMGQAAAPRVLAFHLGPRPSERATMLPPDASTQWSLRPWWSDLSTGEQVAIGAAGLGAGLLLVMMATGKKRRGRRR